MISKKLVAIACLLILSACGGGGGGGGGSNSPDPVNRAPAVNAGLDVTIHLPAATVALDGTVNDDGQPAGAAVSTAWSVSSGPAGATFADVNVVDTTVTFVSEGSYVLMLTADDTGLQGSDTVTVIVEAAPALAGIAVTPAAVSLPTGGTQAFIASGTDQYGASIAVNITWSADGGAIDQAGNYTAGAITGAFTVTATDGAVSGTANVTISIASPPVADAGGPYFGVEGSPVSLDGSGSTDANDDIVSYEWDLDNDGAFDDATGVSATFSAFGSGVFTIGLRVTDADGASNSATTTVTLTNVAPTANAQSVTTAEDTAKAITLTGSDPGFDPLTFAIGTGPTNGALSGTAPNVTYTPNASYNGPDSFTFTVNDGALTSAAATVSITVTAVQVSSQVSGKVTYHEIPHGTPGTGLDYTSIVEMPARLVTVQVINANDDVTVIANTKTDAAGDYSVNLDSNTDVFIRVRAEMTETGPGPSWNFRIVDNTSSDAQYVLDTAEFNTGTANQVRNILAETAFDGTDYTARIGAPFAILDAVHDAFQTVLSADPTINFVPLDTHWSINNAPVFGDQSVGEIGTSNYQGGSPISGIFLLGLEDNDTEEYDQHVIIHEWAHYFEDTIARSDSFGGPHGPGDLLDLRLAFGEGWGNAWSGMATGDSTYLDSFGTNQRLSGGKDVEDGTLLNGANPAPGWYSERSIQEILYDLFDATGDGMDTLSLGFSPLYDVFIDQQSTTTAFTSIFPFIDALKADRPADAAAIDALLADVSIDSVTDGFGTGETNSGGSADTLPVYKTVTVGGPPVNVCSNSEFGGGISALNTIQHVRLTITTVGMHTFTATATVIPGGETTDPDMVLFAPPLSGIFEVFESAVADSETGVSQNLPTGDYIIEVYDYNNLVSGGQEIGRACFDVTVTLP